GGAQSYPSRTKDADDVDFSTGSVGLGVAQTLFAALVQDYVKAKGWAADWPEGRMVALAGDAELDEGNIYEALLEGAKQELRNCWWIIDYNRQSLDAILREGLFQRYDELFQAFGWKVVTLKYGRLLQAAFGEPGGERLRDWIDACSNQLYGALTFQGGAAWRERLTADFAGDAEMLALLERRDDETLARLMTNLAGHDLESLLEAFVTDDDRPTCFICYTIKGWGLPLAGHKDNHAGLMNPAQMDGFRRSIGVRAGREWEPFEGLEAEAAELRAFLDEVPFNRRGTRRLKAAPIPVPERLPAPSARTASTQEGFGRLLDEVARSDWPLADRILTTSPDVTVSTNLGPWVNRRGLFAREKEADTFRTEKVASLQRWEFGPEGQHIELGIAEMNLMLMLAAAGLSHSLFGERLIPVGTLYDPFIARGLDALNYACYQDARFILVGTPSGITLAPEGGAHQSVGTPLIGMAQDGLASFEPAFTDELATILGWAFDYVQRDGSDTERGWLRDESGGSVYLRLSTRPIDQPRREIGVDVAGDIIQGGYWLKLPGPNCEVVIAYQGAVAPEAIAAAGLLGEDRRDVGVLAVTSADRLNAGWQAAERARARGQPAAVSHIERLLTGLPPHCGLVTVIDGHPATLAWMGGVIGRRVKALGVEHFGQTGTIPDLYRHYGLDTEHILAAAEAAAPGRPVRYRSR
ncbi:MAG TPA: transketolase, partial [Afifellaceae bacterium]|nr:transketolase [Afifellaceae bacterium]